MQDYSKYFEAYNLGFNDNASIKQETKCVIICFDILNLYKNILDITQHIPGDGNSFQNYKNVEDGADFDPKKFCFCCNFKNRG